MRNKVVLSLTLFVVFLIPAVIGFAQYGGPTAANTQYQSEDKNKKAASIVITDPEELKEYAIQNGLEIIPTKVETEYNGPK
ncbi:hypothetical protein PAECIP111893_02088 [Paenibacillus plantiphilus]|uniref:Uncharacterized protein n=1 Tax=Paenibacillus plantiphilus TaxID=2905650 RepID=A0ABM9C5J4_9BACL|nr:hypothetical protein [Paenibacillus plantiphilus]CAH1203843.1 hypothetical protein PAECIP111893_02088 [Paenibacillus plantiphilus]